MTNQEETLVCSEKFVKFLRLAERHNVAGAFNTAKIL